MTEVGNYGRQSLGNSSGALPSGTNRDFGTPRSAFPIEVKPHSVPSRVFRAAFGDVLTSGIKLAFIHEVDHIYARYGSAT